MSLTKSDLAVSIHNRLSIPKKRSAALVESILELIKSTLESGEDVMISGFGKFCVKDKSERRGRNPATGGDMYLDARRVVVFKSSVRLKEKVKRRRSIR